MPRFSRHEVITRILDIGLVPTFYHGDREKARKIIEACVEGGAKVVEFTNRGDLAYKVFSELAEWCGHELPDAVFGIGTVIDPSTAALYINSGANFIVGPVLNPEIAKVCNRRKVAYVPGCSTPSEISAAEELGAEIIKVFPARALGPTFIKAIMGPSPWSRLMPSGGVKATREDVFSWIEVGAAALNMGTSLILKDLVKAEDFEGIRDRVSRCIQWIREAKNQS